MSQQGGRVEMDTLLLEQAEEDIGQAAKRQGQSFREASEPEAERGGIYNKLVVAIMRTVPSMMEGE